MNVRIELRFAFYIAALTFIWLMLEFLVGLQDRYIEYHPVVSMFAAVIPILFKYLGMRRKRDVDYDGTATWLQLFRTGMLITLFAAVLMIPLQYAFHNLINPRFFDNMIHHAVEHALANDQNPEKAREDAEATFNLKSYLTQSVIGVLVMGTVLSVLYSFLLRRKHSMEPISDPDFAPPTPVP